MTCIHIIGELHRRKFNPDSIETAVMIGEEGPVTLYAYGQTLSCCLPNYGEDEKQVDFFLRDKLETKAFSFMEQDQKISWPGYDFEDYDLMPDTTPADSLNPEYRKLLREKGESLNRDSTRRADSLSDIGTRPEVRFAAIRRRRKPGEIPPSRERARLSPERPQKPKTR